MDKMAAMTPLHMIITDNQSVEEKLQILQNTIVVISVPIYSKIKYEKNILSFLNIDIIKILYKFLKPQPIRNIGLERLAERWNFYWNSHISHIFDVREPRGFNIFTIADELYGPIIQQPLQPQPLQTQQTHPFKLYPQKIDQLFRKYMSNTYRNILSKYKEKRRKMINRIEN